MMRTGAPRALLRPLAKTSSLSAARLTHNAAFNQARFGFKQTALVPKQTRPVALTTFQPKTALTRSYAKYVNARNPEFDASIAQRTIHGDPSIVSTTSSTHPVFEEVGEKAQEEDTDMMAGVRHDIKVIKETFALNEVPPEALRIGLAGVLPYLATSASTVYCAFELNHAAHNGGVGYLLNEHSAELLLHVLEPLQVGYGAVILSFLGAIHWGLEWAGYGGKAGYSRYAVGVLAPAIAWPSVLMPVEYALITQFLSFNLLYAIDSNATTHGWTPPWYSTYRFILTFIVGTSIVVSLIGRGQIADRIGTMPTAAQRIKEYREDRKEQKTKKAAKDAEEDDE